MTGPTHSEPADDRSDIWVFGYGSLMWNPGFPFVEKVPALLHGFHRSLCVYSIRHRGTEGQPGLVLGLDRGGSCSGVAFRVPASARRETLAYLRDREQRHGVYREIWRPLRVRVGGALGARGEHEAGDPPDASVKHIGPALSFVVDRTHRQYAGRLTFEEQIERAFHATGESGRNIDYVCNTVDILEKDFDICDGPLHRVSVVLRAKAAQGEVPGGGALAEAYAGSLSHISNSRS